MPEATRTAGKQNRPARFGSMVRYVCRHSRVHDQDRFSGAVLAEVLANAQTSVAKERGCIQFDVCVDPADPGRVFLYEVYSDREAFEEHLRVEHFEAFDRSAASWVASKAVKTWELIDR